MENNQKWVNLSYIATAILTAYVLFVVTTKFSIALDFEGRIRSLDKILLGVSAGIGFLLFIGLNRSSVVNTFMNEVVVEVAKVTWPTKDETVKATIAVLIAVLVAGVALWLIDTLGVFLLGLVI